MDQLIKRFLLSVQRAAGIRNSRELRGSRSYLVLFTGSSTSNFRRLRSLAPAGRAM